MKRTVAMLAVLLSQASVFAASPVDVSGIALGAPENEIMRTFPRAHCTAPEKKSAGNRACTVGAKYAGTTATITYYLVNDRVESARVTFSPDEFDGVVKNMTERFGKPNETRREDLVTGAGLKYENLRLDWHVSGTSISAQRFAGRIDESSVKYSTAKAGQFRQGSQGRKNPN